MTNKKKSFCFTDKNLKNAKQIVAKYPKNRQKSAIMPLLAIAQKQNEGWISPEAIEYVATFLSQSFIHVHSVASFYSMFNLKPIGKHHIQICGTTPCWLRGADDIKKSCEEYTNTKCGNTSTNGLFTLSEVECLGACVNAPLVQINNDYYENLTVKSITNILKQLENKTK